jgi:hypothetical protein
MPFHDQLEAWVVFLYHLEALVVFLYHLEAWVFFSYLPMKNIRAENLNNLRMLSQVTKIKI